MSKRLDLTGQIFGRLTVVNFAYVKKRKTYWLCKCDCGNEKIVKGSCLKFGDTKSCGCSKQGINKKHGMVNTRFYQIWKDMKRRCFNSNSLSYNNYGGRGIVVCKRWFEFESFKNDMLNSYSLHCEKFGIRQTQIDRKNNNGNYDRNNCRWVTCKNQSNNRRNNHLLTYQSKTLTLRQWSIKLDINYNSLRSRIQRGWSPQKVFTTPKKINQYC